MLLEHTTKASLTSQALGAQVEVREAAWSSPFGSSSNP